MEFSILWYFYGISYKDTGDLTYPQYRCLLENLGEIKKLENGTEKEQPSTPTSLNATDSEIFIGETLKMLEEHTGKKGFTMDEVNNPLETIKRYKVLSDLKETKTNAK